MGGSSKKQTVGYRYRMGLHLALCQGPVDALQEIQMGDRTAWGDADRAPLSSGHGLTSLSINKPTLFGGDEREGGVVGTIDVLSGHAGQGRNDYLMSRLGSSIPAFRGVLSLVARKILFAANNPYIKPWAVRVRRFTAGWFDAPWMEWNAEVRTWDEDEGQEISVGMNPAHILVQCLTDPHWGMGYPQSTIGWSFWNAAWALSSEGFGLNLIWTRQQPIESFIGQVIDHIGGILYTDPEQGTFELKLLRDDYWIDSLPQLGPDEIVRLERFERAQWGELPNELTVVYTDWQTGGDATVTVENLAAIQLQGGVINQRRDYPGVNYGPLAARLALRDLRALGSPLARMSLTVARDTLERAPLPGDVFLLNWPRLGVDQMVVRVTGIDTGTLGAAEWRIEAMEDVFGMSNTVLSPPPPHVEEPTIEPLSPALVLAVEVPYWELARRLSRADLAYLTDTDTYLGALARRVRWRPHCRGGRRLRTTADARCSLACQRGRCHRRAGDGHQPAGENGRGRLRLSGGCQWGDCRGRCRPGLRCCQRDHRSRTRRARHHTPSTCLGDSVDRCRRMAGIRRCGACPRRVGVRGRNSSHIDRSGRSCAGRQCAADGAGRSAGFAVSTRSYPPQWPE